MMHSVSAWRIRAGGKAAGATSARAATASISVPRRQRHAVLARLFNRLGVFIPGHQQARTRMPQQVLQAGGAQARVDGNQTRPDRIRA